MIHDCTLLLTPVLKIAIVGLLLLAALRDIMTRTVSNWIPYSLAALCTGFAALHTRLLWGMGFGLIILLLCVVCWQRGWMGGADAKLLGAVAVAIGPSDAETFLLAVTLFGGALALSYLVAQYVLPRPGATRPRGLVPRVLRVEAWRIRHRGPLPYACAIAAGTLFVLS
jgi:prepilin peptidase CpaA